MTPHVGERDPVSGETIVRVKLVGETSWSEPQRSSELFWGAGPGPKGEGRIECYDVVSWACACSPGRCYATSDGIARGRVSITSGIRCVRAEQARRTAPWTPDDDPHRARRIGKTLEELHELGAVLARISIQGLTAVDPGTGKTNKQRLEEETADLIAQCRCNIRTFGLSHRNIAERASDKENEMSKWESHFED